MQVGERVAEVGGGRGGGGTRCDFSMILMGSDT